MSDDTRKTYDAIKAELEAAIGAIRARHGKRILLMGATAILRDDQIIVVGATYGNTNDEKLGPLAAAFECAAATTRKNIGRLKT